jgi:hypothetical protein
VLVSLVGSLIGAPPKRLRDRSGELRKAATSVVIVVDHIPTASRGVEGLAR